MGEKLATPEELASRKNPFDVRKALQACSWQHAGAPTPDDFCTVLSKQLQMDKETLSYIYSLADSSLKLDKPLDTIPYRAVDATRRGASPSARQMSPIRSGHAVLARGKRSNRGGVAENPLEDEIVKLLSDPRIATVQRPSSPSSRNGQVAPAGL